MSFGTIPPGEAGARRHAPLEATALAAAEPNETASGDPGTVQSASLLTPAGLLRREAPSDERRDSGSNAVRGSGVRTDGSAGGS